MTIINYVKGTRMKVNLTLFIHRIEQIVEKFYILVARNVMFMCALITYTSTPYYKLSSRHRDIRTRSG